LAGVLVENIFLDVSCFSGVCLSVNKVKVYRVCSFWRVIAALVMAVCLILVSHLLLLSFLFVCVYFFIRSSIEHQCNLLALSRSVVRVKTKTFTVVLPWFRPLSFTVHFWIFIFC